MPRPGSAPEQLALDGAGRVTLLGNFTGSSATFGPVTLAQQGGSSGTTGYLARLGMGPLATRNTALRLDEVLQVWPNPSAGRTVRVQGPAAGQAVQVLDALGRVVAGGVMPARGPLELALPAAAAGGLYVVRAAGPARPLVVE